MEEEKNWKRTRDLNELFTKKVEGGSVFYQRLKKLIDEKHKSFNLVEREMGYSRNALSNYKNYTIPSGIRLIELSDYFHVSPSYLIGQIDEREKGDELDLAKSEELFELFTSWLQSNKKGNKLRN
jgi:Helix-turn-helix.